jgi:phosphate acetyltransferase
LTESRKKQRQTLKTIVLPESEDNRTLLAAADILRNNIARLILIGNEEKVMAKAAELHVSLSGVQIVDPAKDPKFGEYVNTLFELRKAKGMTEEQARQLLSENAIYYGVMMVKMQEQQTALLPVPAMQQRIHFVLRFRS